MATTEAKLELMAINTFLIAESSEHEMYQKNVPIKHIFMNMLVLTAYQSPTECYSKQQNVFLGYV
jgi:hypothetical protein